MSKPFYKSPDGYIVPFRFVCLITPDEVFINGYTDADGAVPANLSSAEVKECAAAYEEYHARRENQR